jgi:hypothetical protein
MKTQLKKKIKEFLFGKEQTPNWTDVDEYGKPLFRIKSNGKMSKQAEITYGAYDFKYVTDVDINLSVGKPITATIKILFPQVEIKLEEDNVKEK